MEELHVLPSGYVMRFERIGGSTGQTYGIYDSFWIYPDGKVINKRGEVAQISPDVIRQWLKTVPMQLSALKPGEILSLMKSCPDCFECQITIYDKERTRVLDWVGRLNNSELATVTVPGIFDWLQSSVWSPLMGAPLQARGMIRSIRQPIEIGEEVLQSKLIRRIEPVYPKRAESAKLSGKVILLITVDEEG